MMGLVASVDGAIAVVGAILSIVVLLRIPKPLFEWLPYSGLFVLCLFYGLVGWALAMFDSFVLIWVAIVGAAVAIAPMKAKVLGRIGGVAIALGGVSAIGFVWFPVARWVAIAFATIAAWAWAVGGVKFRMESVGLPRSFVLRALIVMGWEGLWLGWLIDRALPQVGDWLVKYWVW